MVAGRPSPAPLGPVHPTGSALGGGWGLLWPYGSRVFRWCLDAVSRRAWQGPSHRPAAKFRRGALFEACDEATDAPTDEQASGVAPDAERSEAIQNQGRRATGAREIAN